MSKPIKSTHAHKNLVKIFPILKMGENKIKRAVRDSRVSIGGCLCYLQPNPIRCRDRHIFTKYNNIFITYILSQIYTHLTHIQPSNTLCIEYSMYLLKTVTSWKSTIELPRKYCINYFLFLSIKVSIKKASTETGSDIAFVI